MIDTLKNIILEFHEDGIPKDLIEREVDKDFLYLNLAKIIIGPRRAGKTYFMFQIMKMLKKPLTTYIYINFEDNRLIDFTYKNFEEILNAYYFFISRKKTHSILR